MAKPTGYGGRDYPDFSSKVTSGIVSHTTDLSELAVRLGSLSWFDRMGYVLMQEGFQGGISNWEHNSYPSGAFAVASARYYSTVPYSVRLNTTTDAGSISGIQRSFPFPYISHFGVEMHVKAIVQFKYLYWVLKFYDGTYRYYVSLRINREESLLELYDDVDGYVTIDSSRMRFGANSSFNVIKVTIDLNTEQYVRLMFNELDYNVSNINIRKTSSGVLPYLDMLIALVPVAETVNIVWIDNIIFTTDEPGV